MDGGEMNSRRGLSIILLAFVALGLLYSVATPIFEASDEVSHYAVIQAIVDGLGLPVQQPGVKTAWAQEGSQPPLYYLLMAAATKWVDTQDAAERWYRNPHAAPGDPSLDANRNLVIHSPAEDFPWQGTTLAVHLIRLLSIGLGLVTVAMSYGIARKIFPERPSIASGTAMLIAFNPMFLFISASVNNDNLVIALSSVALYLLVVCWQEPDRQLDRAGWLRRIALGLIAGCAALTKISGLMLWPAIGLILTLRHLRGRDWRGWILSGLLIGGLALVLAGWWYWRNQTLYGDWFGLNVMVAIAGPRTAPVTLAQLVSEFDGFRRSYWALFGAVNIQTFLFAYTVFDLFTLIGLIGWLIWSVSAWRRSDRDRATLLTVLAGFALMIFIGVVRWTMMTPASQGRLMFPAIAVISLMLWLGWETIWQMLGTCIARFAAARRLAGHPGNAGGMACKCVRFPILDRGKWALPIFLVAIAVIAPFRDIAPVYAGPAMITVDQMPPKITPLNVDYGQTLRLLGYTLPPNQSLPGRVEFTLYWQCPVRPATDDSVFVIVYGRGLEEVGKRDAYPYHGLFATRQCAPGMIFVDPYRIPVKSEAIRPTVLRVQVGLKADNIELQPSVADQPITSVMFVGGKIAPEQGQPQLPQIAQRYRFGDSIELMGYDAPWIDGPSIRYRLYWQVLKSPPEDYTIFAHLLDSSGETLRQGDGPPFDGDYPTSWWQAGEQFVEERSIPLSARVADFSVAAGLYRLSDGMRLPVFDAAGNAVPDAQVILKPAPRVQPQ